MKYQEITTKGNYSLILRKNNLDEYAVVHGLDNESGSWSHTVGYWNYGEFSPINQIEALSAALDCFRAKTEEKYISRLRLEELATKIKDAFVDWCLKECVMEYVDEELDMTDYEKEWFGLNEVEEEQNLDKLLNTLDELETKIDEIKERVQDYMK